MKLKGTSYYFAICLLVFFCSCCGEKDSPKIGSLDFGEVNPGKASEVLLPIEFNDAAMNNPEAFLEFEYKNSLNEPIPNVIFKVSSNVVSGKFKIKPSDVGPDGNVKLGVQFSENATEKDYEGYLMLVNASDELKQNITFGDSTNTTSINNKIGVFHAKYVVPMAEWLFWTILILSVFIVIGTFVFILTRDNMPFGNKTFKYGTIGFPNGEIPSAKLEKFAIYDISKAFGIDAGVTLEPYDKKENYKHKRMARIRNKSNLVVTILYDGIEQIIGVTEDLYNMDEVKIITTDNKICHISYTNNKNIRSII